MASINNGCTKKVIRGIGRSLRYNFKAPVITLMFGYLSWLRSAFSPSKTIKQRAMITQEQF